MFLSAALPIEQTKTFQWNGKSHCFKITTCLIGPMGALAGKLLSDMGFTDVSILIGGVQAWKDAGLPTA